MSHEIMATATARIHGPCKDFHGDSRENKRIFIKSCINSAFDVYVEKRKK